MTATTAALRRRELGKLGAFARRDLLILVSYRAAFIGQWATVFLQVGLFYFLSRIIDPEQLPAFAGNRVTYLEFVTVGIAFSQLLVVTMAQMSRALRTEQLMGTLESLLVSPSSTATVLIGSVFFPFLYEPFRATVFVALMTAAFGLHLDPGGVLPAITVFLAFLPFAWGLAMVGAASLITFRRDPLIGAIGTLLALGSGAFYPTSALPAWFQTVADINPLTRALEAARLALLGGAGWSGVGDAVVVLVPAGVLALGAGLVAFRLALRRERRKGTLFLY